MKKETNEKKKDSIQTPPWRQSSPKRGICRPNPQAVRYTSVHPLLHLFSPSVGPSAHTKIPTAEKESSVSCFHTFTHTGSVTRSHHDLGEVWGKGYWHLE